MLRMPKISGSSIIALRIFNSCDDQSDSCGVYTLVRMCMRTARWSPSLLLTCINTLFKGLLVVVKLLYLKHFKHL